jgi:ABC-type dipeptide/oligopeptide/nickel transport system permease subunit
MKTVLAHGSSAYAVRSMGELSSFRRAIVFFCLAMVLLAALTPTAASMPLAILVIQWFLIAITVRVFWLRIEEQNYGRQALTLLTFSPRPPPAR